MKTTYTSDTVELECAITENAATVTWSKQLEAKGTDTLFTLIVEGGDTIDGRQDSATPEEYDNIGHNQTPVSFFNLIISTVDKDDGGTYQCANAPGGIITYDVTVEGKISIP